MPDYIKDLTLSDDELHVLMDAVGELIDAIDRNETGPWTDYDCGACGDENEVCTHDPKRTMAGYMQLLTDLDA